MKNIDKLIDLFLLINILNAEIKEKEIYANHYLNFLDTFSLENKKNHYMDKSVEELVSEIDVLLLSEKEGSIFLKTFYPIEEILNYFAEIKDTRTVNLLNVLFKNIGKEGAEISPLSIFLLSSWEDDVRIKNYITKYLPEKEINYDNLIKVNGKSLTGLEILNNLSFEPIDLLVLLKDDSYFNNNNVFYKSQQIKSILNFVNNNWKDEYKRDLISLNKTMLLDNLGDLKLNQKMSAVLNNQITFEDIKGYIESKVFSIDKIYNLLNYLPTIDKDNEINKYIKTILLDVSSYTISLMNVEVDKQKYREDKIIREKIDNKYYNFLNGIKKCYGDSFLNVVIRNINEMSNKELSNVIDIKKVAYEQIKKLPFYYLLKNLNKKTINFLLDEGYKLHPSEINIINKNKKYKNIINEKNLSIINNIEIEQSLPVRIKEILSNINKNNLEELKKILKEDRYECINYFNESRKELDSKIHYSYSDKKPITKNLISSTSPVMSMILSKELDVIYTFIKSGMEFTEKEVSLLYEPFSVTKRTINSREDIDNEFLKFINNYEKPLNNLFYNLIVEGKIRDLKYGKWNETIPKIINILFDKSYHCFQDKEKLMFLDVGFNSVTNKEISIFIYDKLPEEDKELLCNYMQTNNEENYFKTILKTVCQKDVNKRAYLETFFDYIGKIFINNIENKNKDPNFYISMLKENEKEIAFMDIDLLDGLISKIEKNELTKSMNTNNVNIKSKNRL